MGTLDNSHGSTAAQTTAGSVLWYTAELLNLFSSLYLELFLYLPINSGIALPVTGVDLIPTKTAQFDPGETNKMSQSLNARSRLQNIIEGTIISPLKQRMETD